MKYIAARRSSSPETGRRLRSIIRIGTWVALLGCTVAAGAETVMLYMDNAAGQSYVRDENRAYVSAVEEGIMGEFFDAGHIIFNSGISYQSPAETPFKSERPSVRIAKAGGAGYLLEVVLAGATDEPDVPQRAEFTFSELESNRVLSEGDLPVAQISLNDETVPARERSTKEERLCIIFGREIARLVLGTW